jgi:hypothetical protein
MGIRHGVNARLLLSKAKPQLRLIAAGVSGICKSSWAACGEDSFSL